MSEQAPIPMTDQLLAPIRAALEPGADEAAREGGVKACRDLMTVLGAKPGEPIVAAAAPATPTPPAPATPLSGVPVAQILDAVIAKLKAHLPADGASPPPAVGPALRIPFIAIPKMEQK